MDLNLTIEPLPSTPKDREVEIVERKGVGHPDTICDGLAENISAELAGFYEETFGRLLHYNVDKILLRGGQAEPAFGNGRVTEPIQLVVAGRASSRDPEMDGALAARLETAAYQWFQQHLTPKVSWREIAHVDAQLRPGSRDLAFLFENPSGLSKPKANDTSIGVGFAPLSPVETTVLAVETALREPSFRRQFPGVGDDVKIMALRHGGAIRLVVACAMRSPALSSGADYLDHKVAVRNRAARVAEDHCGPPVRVAVNEADVEKNPESYYLTVSGTSAEAGDDGEAGRGNRANGLITPARPMTMESPYGKNPRTHTGKIYQIAAQRIAERLVREGAAPSAECLLVSGIGRPIDAPEIASLRLGGGRNRHQAGASRNLGHIVEDELSRCLQPTETRKLVIDVEPSAASAPAGT